MKAPNALISSVLASSKNCSPWKSFPRTNSGICRWIRCERRCSWYIGTIVVFRCNTFSRMAIGTPVIVLPFESQFECNSQNKVERL